MPLAAVSLPDLQEGEVVAVGVRKLLPAVGGPLPSVRGRRGDKNVLGGKHRQDRCAPQHTHTAVTRSSPLRNGTRRSKPLGRIFDKGRGF